MKKTYINPSVEFIYWTPDCPILAVSAPSYDKHVAVDPSEAAINNIILD